MEILSALVRTVFEQFGVGGLIVVTMGICTATSVAWMLTIRKMEVSKTTFDRRAQQFVDQIAVVIGYQERQHLICSHHYERQAELTSGLQALTIEMRSLVKAIEQRDRDRDEQLLDLVRTLIQRPEVASAPSTAPPGSQKSAAEECA